MRRMRHEECNLVTERWRLQTVDFGVSDCFPTACRCCAQFAFIFYETRQFGYVSLRPAEPDQFLQRIRHCRVQGDSTQVRGFSLIGLALELQNVTELQVRVRHG